MGNKQSSGGDGVAAAAAVPSPPAATSVLPPPPPPQPPPPPLSSSSSLSNGQATTAANNCSSSSSSTARANKSGGGSSFTSKIARKTVKTIVSASPLLRRRSGSSASTSNKSHTTTSASSSVTTVRSGLSLPINNSHSHQHQSRVGSVTVDSSSSKPTQPAPKAPKRRKSSQFTTVATSTPLSPFSNTAQAHSLFADAAETLSTATTVASVYHDARSQPFHSPTDDDNDDCDLLESLTTDDDPFHLPHSISHNLLDEIQLELDGPAAMSSPIGHNAPLSVAESTTDDCLLLGEATSTSTPNSAMKRQLSSGTAAHPATAMADITSSMAGNGNQQQQQQLSSSPSSPSKQKPKMLTVTAYKKVVVPELSSPVTQLDIENAFELKGSPTNSNINNGNYKSSPSSRQCPDGNVLRKVASLTAETFTLKTSGGLSAINTSAGDLQQQQQQNSALKKVNGHSGKVDQKVQTDGERMKVCKESQTDALLAAVSFSDVAVQTEELAGQMPATTTSNAAPAPPPPPHHHHHHHHLDLWVRL
ncbi:hypothetical protein TYRP_008612 [Tyrophagus putrescentiae]|nr:hypothetical protein TYRP_008612 [Tyrophagus putrescentiae]